MKTKVTDVPERLVMSPLPMLTWFLTAEGEIPSRYFLNTYYVPSPASGIEQNR